MVKQYLIVGGYTKAIVIKNVKSDEECIRAENEYISKKLGRYGIDWETKYSHLSRRDGKMFDEFEVSVVKTGKVKVFLFDVTELFKKLLE